MVTERQSHLKHWFIHEDSWAFYEGEPEEDCATFLAINRSRKKSVTRYWSRYLVILSAHFINLPIHDALHLSHLSHRKSIESTFKTCKRGRDNIIVVFIASSSIFALIRSISWTSSVVEVAVVPVVRDFLDFPLKVQRFQILICIIHDAVHSTNEGPHAYVMIDKCRNLSSLNFERSCRLSA